VLLRLEAAAWAIRDQDAPFSVLSWLKASKLPRVSQPSGEPSVCVPYTINQQEGLLK
jgi:hypothetical protein